MFPSLQPRHSLNRDKLKRAPLFSRRLTMLCPVFLSLTVSLGLMACSDKNSKEPFGSIDTAANTNDATSDSAPFCYAKSVPFAHSLCTVSQSKLTQTDSPYSLRLFWKSGNWQGKGAPKDTDKALPPLYTFDGLITDLQANTPKKNVALKFAVNAGMYNSEFAPIGYTVINGQQILSLNLKQGGGNFHMLPNGVLWWDRAGKVQITESQALASMLDDKTATPLYATQSGPMLVIDGKIHPKFRSDSPSKKRRNGVGVCDNGDINFVTTNELVNFYALAHYFKEDLLCPNALFLDGGIASALYAPDLSIKDDKNMGVMVGLVKTH